MNDVGSALRIPMYLAAPDRDGLVQLMLENNLRAGWEFKYFDISESATGEWTCWYYDKVKITKDMLLDSNEKE